LSGWKRTRGSYSRGAGVVFTVFQNRIFKIRYYFVVFLKNLDIFESVRRRIHRISGISICVHCTIVVPPTVKSNTPDKRSGSNHDHDLYHSNINETVQYRGAPLNDRLGFFVSRESQLRVTII